MSSPLPHSAISSWSGFVYQGKIALYHTLRLINESVFEGTSVTDFELQLDSTDDFAIYVGAHAISVHQVKAKCSPHRSAYVDALEQSSNITTDCTPLTTRHFHISREIDNAEDYINGSGVKVKFYTYDKDLFCSISDIETKTKEAIKVYCEKEEILHSEILIDKKYCLLSELITKRVLKVHAETQSGKPARAAAYDERLTSADIKLHLKKSLELSDDDEYKLKKLKFMFANSLERYIANNDVEFSSLEIERSRKVFSFIYGLLDSDLKNVLCSLRPAHPDDEVRENDIQYYADVITEISTEIILNGIPHFNKSQKKYLPTAIHLRQKHVSTFKEQLITHIRSNHHLANILFEYNTLISAADVLDISIDAKSDKITNLSLNKKFGAHITKEFPVSIISIAVAEGELNA